MTQTELTPTASLTGKWNPYPAYKDSGVEWLGEIPTHWEVKRSDSFLHESREVIDPKALDGISVFHYSIPLIEETGDGRIEDGSIVDSSKLLLRGGELLVLFPTFTLQKEYANTCQHMLNLLLAVISELV